MSRMLTVVALCACFALAAGPAAAQSPLGRPTPRVVVPAGSQLSHALVGSARLGMSQPRPADAVAARDARAPAPRAGLRHRGPGIALMLVGAAGVVTGLLLDESLITVLGAGTGLVGLYLYLR